MGSLLGYSRRGGTGGGTVPDDANAMTTRARPRASVPAKRNGASRGQRAPELEAQVERQNAELGLVNEIGAALARQLEFDAIIDLVGVRLGDIVGAPDVLIGLYDAETREITFRFELDGGRQVDASDRAPVRL